MTLSLTYRYPGPESVNNSRVSGTRVTVASDTLARPASLLSLNMWIAGVRVIASGVPVADLARITGNDVGGFDIQARLFEPFAPGDRIVVRIQVDDVISSSPRDDSWSFTVVDDVGPRLSAPTIPAPNSDIGSVPATVSVAVRGAVDNIVDFTVVQANLAYVFSGDPGAGNLVAFQRQGANSTRSFRGLAGRVFRTAGGDWRQITDVVGSIADPGTGVVTEIARYDGAQLSSTSTTLTIFRDLGLDVTVSGVQVVRRGEPRAWSAALTTVGDARVVTVTPPPGAIVPGDRVPVHVRAADADGRVSEIGYGFSVGRRTGPVVSEILPRPGSRSVSVSAPVSFRLTSPAGVAPSAVAVTVDDQVVFSSGLFTGPFSGSSAVVVDANTIDFQLTRSSPYADGRIVHFDVQSQDGLGTDGERRVWSLHFGTPVGSETTAPSDVVRMVAFDVTSGPFFQPSELRHNGYAADGYWYDEGVRDSSRVASWRTAFGEFPGAGHFVSTPASGWSLHPASDVLPPAPWMSCAPLPSPSSWNMAGNTSSTLSDADMAIDFPRLALSGAWGTVIVDFSRDRAWLVNEAGKRISATGIGAASANQAGGENNVGLASAAAPHLRVAVSGRDDIVIGSDQALTLVSQQSSTIRPGGGTWVRIRASDGLVAAAANDSGSGRVEIWNLADFTSFFELYDDMSSPALPATEIVDIDFRGQGLFVADVGGVTVVDRRLGTSQTVLAADMDLLGYGDISCLSASWDTISGDRGYLYVGTQAPGRVSRWRTHWPASAGRAVVVSDGAPVSSLSAFGRIVDSGDAYLRSAMVIKFPTAFDDSAALESGSTLSAAPGLDVIGSSSVSTSSALSALGLIDRLGIAALSSSSQFTADGEGEKSGSAALVTSSVLTADGIPEDVAEAALASGSSMSVSATLNFNHPGTAGLVTGSGMVVSATLNFNHPGTAGLVTGSGMVVSASTGTNQSGDSGLVTGSSMSVSTTLNFNHPGASALSSGSGMAVSAILNLNHPGASALSSGSVMTVSAFTGTNQSGGSALTSGSSMSVTATTTP